MSLNNSSPKLLSGFGNINFGKQYRQGNRIYDSREIAMALTAAPVGNTGGYSYLYIVPENKCGKDEIVHYKNDILFTDIIYLTKSLIRL